MNNRALTLAAACTVGAILCLPPTALWSMHAVWQIRDDVAARAAAATRAVALVNRDACAATARFYAEANPNSETLAELRFANAMCSRLPPGSTVMPPDFTP
jgi:hypothetical protein